MLKLIEGGGVLSQFNIVNYSRPIFNKLRRLIFYKGEEATQEDWRKLNEMRIAFKQNFL